MAAQQPTSIPPATLREAVGVFDSSEALYSAVDELLSAGFDRTDISMMASLRTIEETLGHTIERIEDAADDPTVPRRAHVSPASLGDAEGMLIGVPLYVGALAAAGAVLASGGALAGAIIAAGLAGGAGAALGSAFAQFIGEIHGDYLHEQLDRGGILLWVAARDAEHERRACDVLTRNGAHGVHGHAIAVG